MKVILSLVLLLLATLSPSIEGASVSMTSSVSNTVSVTNSGSVSVTNSMSVSVTNTVSVSVTNSYTNSISGSVSITISTSLTQVPPNTVYNLVDECPKTPQPLCLFYNGPFTAYQLTLTNTSGGTWTINTTYRQFDVTPINTGGFYQPGFSYMVEVRGLTSLIGGVPTGSGAMLTVSKSAVKGYVPPSNSGPYINNLICKVTTSPTVQCTYYRGTIRFKKIKILTDCYASGTSQTYRKKMRWPGGPLTSSFTQNLLTSAFCYIRVRGFYKNLNDTRIRTTVLT